MVVDVPANAPCTIDADPGGTAGLLHDRARRPPRRSFPDDPSNVYHSYLRDHLKFRIVHAGSKEHHIHHQHAHQWLHTPDDDDSSYLDSQAIGPGSAFTLEMVYNGSGNRNLTVGDSIFHCHFYPHFAQGMWAMWRVHDVLETGTPLDEKGRPAPETRAPCRTERSWPARRSPRSFRCRPSPWRRCPRRPSAIVNGQVKVSGDGNPGYPFFVPGVAGHRPPHPPLDTIDDGGLPRHVITGGTFTEVHTRLDFTKTLEKADAFQLPETGTKVEEHAMKFHAQRSHTTFTPEGDVGQVRHQRPAAGSRARRTPIPASPTRANRPDNPLLYKAAEHPARRDSSIRPAGTSSSSASPALWADVAATLNGTRAPEPLFFRANSRDCITYELDEPPARQLRAGRLPGAHADGHHRPAHPPGEVRRHGLGRRGQWLQLRGRQLRAGGCAGAHRSHQRTSAACCRTTARACMLSAKPHPFFGTQGRADHGPELVCGRGPEQRRRGPHAAHRLHARSLRTVHAPAGRALCGPGRRAAARPVVRSRDRALRSAAASTVVPPAGAPTSSRSTRRRATASSCSSSPTSSTPTSRTTTFPDPKNVINPAGQDRGRSAVPAGAAGRLPRRVQATLSGSGFGGRPGHDGHQLSQ